MVLRFFEHPKSWNQGTSSPFPTPHIQLVCARPGWLPCAASPSAIPALLWKVSCVEVEWHNIHHQVSPSHSKVFNLNWLRIPGERGFVCCCLSPRASACAQLQMPGKPLHSAPPGGTPQHDIIREMMKSSQTFTWICMLTCRTVLPKLLSSHF